MILSTIIMCTTLSASIAMVEREQKLKCRNCATAFSFFLQNTQKLVPVHVRHANGAEKENHNKFSLIDKIVSMPSQWRRWRHGNLITENKIMCNRLRHILMSYEFLVVVLAHSAFLLPFVCMCVTKIGHKTLDRNSKTIHVPLSVSRSQQNRPICTGVSATTSYAVLLLLVMYLLTPVFIDSEV